jgi:sugar phosphate isomerase/epimerase
MKIGIQMYNLRDKTTDKSSLMKTLDRVAEFGYDGVEFFTYCDVEPEELKAKLKDLNLEVTGVHLGFQKWFDCLDEEIEYAKRAGIKRMIMPFIPPERRTEADYRVFAVQFGEFLKKCRNAGLEMVYHNHQFEFELLDGKYVLDCFLQSNPDMLLELDSFWAFFAKVDPIGYMQKYADRLPLLHIKDYTELDTQPMPLFCAAGTGKMKNREIAAAANKIGVQWIIFEQDNSQIDVFESSRIALQNLRNYGL